MLAEQIKSLEKSRRISLRDELLWAQNSANKPKVRSRIEFARQCLRIPEGKHEGSLWRAEFQPWAYHLLHCMDTMGFRRFAITGCVQSGKTLICVVFNLLWHLFEMKQSVIFIIPEVAMAEKKWTDEIKPVINKSRWLRKVAYGDASRTDLLAGRGSKGGFSSVLRFANGTRLEFMPGTGGDAKRSSSTAPVVMKTEVDRMDVAAESSREASAAQTSEDRTESYGDSAYIYEECTMTTEDGRINQQLIAGTKTTPMSCCPHCRTFVRITRNDLVGIEDCKNTVEARTNGTFICPECKEILSEDDRRDMQDNSVPVSEGQSVSLGADGEPKVSGDVKPTEIMSFYWNAWDNRFWTTGRLAAREWMTLYGDDLEDEDKQAKQKRWTEPVSAVAIDVSSLSMQVMIRRQTDLPSRVVPDGTKWVSQGVDVRETQLHYVVRAWTHNDNKLVGHMIDVGFIPVRRDEIGAHDGVIEALSILRDERSLAGIYRDSNGKEYTPGWTLIDAGFKESWIWEFSLDCARRGLVTWVPVLGRGQSDPNIRGTYVHPEKLDQNDDPTKRKVLWIGDQCHLRRSSKYDYVFSESGITQPPMYLLINTDEGKSFLRDGYNAPDNTNGALRTFKASSAEERNVLNRYRKEVMAEKERTKYVGGRGSVRFYENTSRAPNHYGDCDNYACYAAQLCGAPVAVLSANASSVRRAVAENQIAKNAPITMPDGRAYMEVNG